MLQGRTIGFLGAGSMAEALISGLIAQGVVQPEQLLVTNRANRERLADLAGRYGVRIGETKAQVAAESDVLVLACKPKDVGDLLAEVREQTRVGQILLSVAAGVTTEFIAERVAPGVQVLRAMPNTSSQVGESASAFCLGAGAGQEARLVGQAIMGAVGMAVEVPESLMDAVTGLAGSGPAYIYLLIEALVEAGCAVGLPENVARDLTVQTLKGAVKMVAETGEDPAVLRQKVTSPNGTTAAGLQVLQAAGFREALIGCVARATERSRELGAQVVATKP